MDANGWIALAGVSISGLGIALGFHRYFTKLINDLRIEREAKLSEAQRIGDEKRARIYERLDCIKKDHKEEIEKMHKEIMDSYVHAKVCELTRNPINQNIADIKVLLSDIEKKLDKLIVDNAAGK